MFTFNSTTLSSYLPKPQCENVEKVITFITTANTKYNRLAAVQLLNQKAKDWFLLNVSECTFVQKSPIDIYEIIKLNIQSNQLYEFYKNKFAECSREVNKINKIIKQSSGKQNTNTTTDEELPSALLTQLIQEIKENYQNIQSIGKLSDQFNQSLTVSQLKNILQTFLKKNIDIIESSTIDSNDYKKQLDDITERFKLYKNDREKKMLECKNEIKVLQNIIKDLPKRNEATSANDKDNVTFNEETTILLSDDSNVEAINDTKNKLSYYSEQLQKSENEIKQKIEEIMKLNKELETLTNRNICLGVNITDNEDTIKKLENQIQLDAQNIQTLNQKIKEEIEKLQQEKQVNLDLQNKIKELNFVYNSKITELQQTIKNLKEQIIELTNEKAILEQRNDSNSLSIHQQEILNSQARIETLQDEIDKKNKFIEESNVFLATQVNDLEKELEKCQSKLLVCEADLLEKEETIAILNEQTIEFNQKNKTLNADYEKALSKLKEMNYLKSTIEKNKEELNEKSKELDIFIKELRITNEILENCKTQLGESEYKNSKYVQKLQEFKQSCENEKKDLNEKILTCQGEINDNQFTINQQLKTINDLEQNQTSLEDEYKKISIKYEELLSAFKIQETSFELLQNQNQQNIIDLENCKRELNEIMIKLNLSSNNETNSEKLKKLEQLYKKSTERLTILESDKATYEQEYNDQQKIITEYKKLLDECNKQKDKDLKKLTEQNNKYKEEINNLNDINKSFKLEFDKLQKEYETIYEERDRLLVKISDNAVERESVIEKEIISNINLDSNELQSKIFKIVEETDSESNKQIMIGYALLIQKITDVLMYYKSLTKGSVKCHNLIVNVLYSILRNEAVTPDNYPQSIQKLEKKEIDDNTFYFKIPKEAKLYIDADETIDEDDDSVVLAPETSSSSSTMPSPLPDSGFIRRNQNRIKRRVAQNEIKTLNKTRDGNNIVSENASDGSDSTLTPITQPQTNTGAKRKPTSNLNFENKIKRSDTEMRFPTQQNLTEIQASSSAKKKSKKKNVKANVDNIRTAWETNIDFEKDDKNAKIEDHDFLNTPDSESVEIINTSTVSNSSTFSDEPNKASVALGVIYEKNKNNTESDSDSEEL
ncbi:putative desmoplakin [Gryllus bimaculatus nudivirus]|uniref:Putative desmoplakin n=1 Tax=Gryllus bimaculatus nudivirus TaxID=432587 RepID=A4L240_9VIRU|nr:putative desmoplakin [Gryllus bimaculatus nudivirus]ABO45410.1 putative desmoplakin [Gryllus bimaculatus nudivirus]